MLIGSSELPFSNPIQSIPRFIIEGQAVIDGAARADEFVSVFREIEARGSIARGHIFGDILGVPANIMQGPSHHAK